MKILNKIIEDVNKKRPFLTGDNLKLRGKLTENNIYGKKHITNIKTNKYSIELYYLDPSYKQRLLVYNIVLKNLDDSFDEKAWIEDFQDFGFDKNSIDKIIKVLYDFNIIKFDFAY